MLSISSGPHAGSVFVLFNVRTKFREVVVGIVPFLIVGGIAGWIAGKIMRGGGYGHSLFSLRAANRPSSVPQTGGAAYVGARCARNAP